MNKITLRFGKNAIGKLLFTTLFIFTCQLTFGQLAQWPLTANGTPTGVNTNATATSLNKGAGIAAAISYGATGAFVDGWTTGGIDLTDYFEVTIAPNASYTMNVTQVNFSERRSGTGIRNYQVRWSVDNFTNFTTIATVAVPDDTSERSGNITGLNINVAEGQVLKVRFYGYTSEAAGGTWRINDASLNIVGTVTPVGPVAPTVTTTAATSVTTAGATLNGTVDANNSTTNITFEYGTTVSYGSSATASPSSLSNDTETAVSATIGSLALNTLYNYRTVGTVSGTPTNGNNITFYTLAATPGVVVVSNPQLTTLAVTVNATTENSNPSATEYAIQETTGGLYVQANGSLGASAVWQTAATWATVTITGLANNTTYTFQAKARNGANVETAFGGTASGTTLAPATVDWCNLQWPTSQTIEEGATFTVYARVNEPGITNSPGEGTAIDAWIGYSATNGTPDGTWTWIPATYFGDDGSDNDEYSTSLGAGITPGTYYYVSRFSINGGPFVYGGKNNAIWSSNADSAVLTVNSNLVDFCNVQFPTTINITEGGSGTVYARVYEPGVTPGGGQGAGISAWIGYSTTNGTPDNTWTWVSATYNADATNDDEYQATIGTGLAPGTYYYASRFQKTGSTQYQYGD
ncbi:MAG TPA: hypothetical protein PLH25_01370, partial [Flavobacterium sp.]|nr:hypothetical protein [Flavobacterium sp.]